MGHPLATLLIANEVGENFTFLETFMVQLLYKLQWIMSVKNISDVQTKFKLVGERVTQIFGAKPEQSTTHPEF